MVNTILNLFIAFVVIIEFFLALRVIFNPQIVFKKTVFFIITTSLIIFSFIINDNDIFTYLAFVANFILLLFYTKEIVSQRLIYAVFSVLIVPAVEYLCSIPCTIIANRSEYLPSEIEDILILILKHAFTIAILFGIFLYNKKMHNDEISDFFDSNLTISVGVFTIIVFVLASLLNIAIPYTEPHFTGFNGLSRFTITVSYIAICIMVLFVVKLRQSNYNIKIKGRNEKLFLEEQNAYLQRLLDQEADTRKFRHDINNQLLAIRAMATSQDKDKFIEAIDEVIGEMKQISSNTYNVNNEQISGAMLYYFPQAKNTTISVSGKVEQTPEIPPLSLMLIATNIFKNAVESVNCCNLNDLFIDVCIDSVTKDNSDYLHMLVKNSCDKSVEFRRNGLPITSKPDKTNHGFGAEKISQLAKQYGGKVSFSLNNNVFTTDLLLKYK